MLTLVLLPGMDGTGVFFEDFVGAVDGEFKPLVVSYPDDPSLGYAELEALVRSRLPRNEKFLLLGESFSGPIAISVAASNPSGLAGLILCVTFARNPHPLLPVVTSILRPFPPVRVPAFVQHRNLFGKYNSPRLRAKLREVRAQVSQETLKARLEAVARVDVSDKLRRVTVPVLDLRATKDRVVSRGSGEHIRRILPTIDITQLDTSHQLLQTIPFEALAAMRKFVRDRIASSN